MANGSEDEDETIFTEPSRKGMLLRRYIALWSLKVVLTALVKRALH